MAKTSLILTSTEQTTGKTLQKTITDVNPDASNEALLGFAQRLNALTTNVYGKTDRIDKLNVDTSGASKIARTITLSATTMTRAELKAAFGNYYAKLATATYTGDDIPTAYIVGGAREEYGVAYSSLGLGVVGLLWVAANANRIDNDSRDTVTIKVVQFETETHKAAEATFTITA